eukprot:2352792-Pyramimonas_sp.AAC.1
MITESHRAPACRPEGDGRLPAREARLSPRHSHVSARALHISAASLCCVARTGHVGNSPSPARASYASHTHF